MKLVEFKSEEEKRKVYLKAYDDYLSACHPQRRPYEILYREAMYTRTITLRLAYISERLGLIRRFVLNCKATPYSTGKSLHLEGKPNRRVKLKVNKEKVKVLRQVLGRKQTLEL